MGDSQCAFSSCSTAMYKISCDVLELGSPYYEVQHHQCTLYQITKEKKRGIYYTTRKETLIKAISLSIAGYDTVVNFYHFLSLLPIYCFL